MRYQLSHANIEATIIRQAKAQKVPIPEGILNAPSLLPGNEFYYRAFLNLTTCRSAAYESEGVISYFSIVQYGNLLGLSQDEIEDLAFIIGHMDDEYLKVKSEKMNANRK